MKISTFEKKLLHLLRNIIDDMPQSICANHHHKKHDNHAGSVCPVVIRFTNAINQAISALKESK